MRILSLSALLAVPLIAIAPPASAAPIRPYSVAALQAAQKAGQPVLVDIHADWCPTCRAQAPTIAEISRDPAYAKLLILKLDFDAQANERRALGVQKQSTLIVYHGAVEKGRTLGITDRAQIRSFVAGAFK